MAAPRVHLFDGHVYIFRAYYSMPSMTADDGTPDPGAEPEHPPGFDVR